MAAYVLSRKLQLTALCAVVREKQIQHVDSKAGLGGFIE